MLGKNYALRVVFLFFLVVQGCGLLGVRCVESVETWAELCQRFGYAQGKREVHGTLLCPGALDLTTIEGLENFRQKDVRFSSAFPAVFSSPLGISKTLTLVGDNGAVLRVRIHVGYENAEQAHKLVLGDLAYSYSADLGLSVNWGHGLGDFVMTKSLGPAFGNIIAFCRGNVGFVLDDHGTLGGDLERIACEIDRRLVTSVPRCEVPTSEAPTSVLELPSSLEVTVEENIVIPLEEIDRVIDPWSIAARCSVPRRVVEHGFVEDGLLLQPHEAGEYTVGVCLLNKDTLWSKWALMQLRVTEAIAAEARE